ncbi:NUDIX hydrolase [Kitasatospora sp. NPDC004723]|uniref:NUDIX hydrolase n=1 Tax=Kitasatospora sp. NPDC004723 TaxID=3154288 RepID=UPI0033BD473A
MSKIVEKIRYTADVVCFKDDSVLLIERKWDPYQGRFALPGGHVDPGETSLAAAVRELEEETGLAVLAGDLVLVGVYDTPDRDPRGRYVSAAYAVEAPEGTTAEAGDDAAKVKWVRVEDLPPLAFDHTGIVADAWRQHRARQG